MEGRFETFTVLINRISRSIRRIKNREMADYGLRSAHISCLYYLYLTPGLTATELGERCEEDKATVSRALEYLEERGYLCGGEGGERRYKSPLRLTEAGAEVAGRIAGKVEEVLDEVSVELTEAERVAFYRSLCLISDHLERVSRREQKEDRKPKEESI